MKGLELSEAYYREICVPMLQINFPKQLDLIAVGLVGEGSECYGYDDELSQDHDFGPGVMIWLRDAEITKFGWQLQLALNNLPQEFAGFTSRNTSQWGAGRMGVHSIIGFYYKFIGLTHPPETISEWSQIPESNLSKVTNGKVFADPLGVFSRFRYSLLEYYPEDVRLKKIVAGCMNIAQAGQYNFPRCLKRQEILAAWIAMAEFIEAASSIIFLLNRCYKPFYKWMPRALGELPILGKQTQEILTHIIDPSCSSQVEQIEWLCSLIVAELQQQGLTHSTSDFLLDHAQVIQTHIKDNSLRDSSSLIG